MVLQLLAGMLLGSVLASAVWGFFVKTGKSRSEALRRERDDIMHSIGEVWVEIDSLLSSYKCGVVDDKGFHDTFAAKIETINQQLKPNMHLFDVYYVKYLENQIEQYKKTAHFTGMAQPITKGTAADHELETSYAVVGHHEAEAKPEDSGTSLKEESVTEKIETDNTIDSPEAVIEEMVDAGILSDAGGDQETAAPEETGVDGDDKAEIPEKPEETDTITMKEVHSEEEAAEVEVPVENKEAFEINASPSAPTEEAAEEEQESPEVTGEEQLADDRMFDVVIADDKKSDDQETIEESDVTLAESEAEEKNETAISSDETIETDSVREKIAESVAASKSDIESEFFGDEDFTMETLMDVDINSISPNIEPSVSSSEKNEVQSTEEESEKKNDELEVVIASNASHSDSISEDSKEDQQTKKVTASILDDDDIPEETTYTPVGELEKRSTDTEKLDDQFSEAEEFEVTIAEDAAASTSDTSPPVEETVEQEEMTFFESELVTGDDVAETIAALESTTPINPKSPEKAEKKPEKKKSKTSKSKKKKKEPVAVTEKKVATEEKKKDGEESITGDDVVDQIDEFFGLIE